MPRVAAIIRFAIWLFVSISILLGLAFYLVRYRLPKTSGRLSLPGPRSRIEIIRDRWGIPHIYASNLHDLFFASGFVQGQDRFWQMELNRRVAAGRLAEIFGQEALEIDRLVRRIGFAEAAQSELQAMAAEDKELLDAFTAGINAYLKTSALPIEFALLRYRPKIWESVDALCLARFINWGLAGNWDEEILRSWTIERFGVQTAEDLESSYPAGKPLIVPPGARSVAPPLDILEDYQLAQAYSSVGSALSNNWAVGSKKSTTGMPLLANDPHLILTNPGTWCEMHLETPEVRISGVALAGLPGILIGHNDRIAWGVTAALADGDDLFVERFNPDDHTQYEYQGKWEKAKVRVEEIAVRGGRSLSEEVLITRHGPVISPCIKGETRTLALRTTGLEPAQHVKGLALLMRAGNWDQFREASSYWPGASINFVYADIQGNVGYQMAGLVPIRRKGHGLVPAPGWTGEYDWEAFIPFEELPSVLNPPTHWVASANNKVVEDGYPHFLGNRYSDGFRMERIAQLLEGKDKLSVEDFRAMQADVFALHGRELASWILSIPARDQWTRRAQTYVKAWDSHLAADSVAACLVEAFFSQLVQISLREKLGDWSAFYLGRGIHPLRRGGGFFANAASWLSSKVRERPQWFADKTWPQAFAAALAAAIEELRKLLGNDMSSWQWGRLHQQSFKHTLGRKPPLDRFLNKGPVPVGGDANTLFQTAYAPHQGYDVNRWSVSWRQIIDLSDFNKSLAVLPTGQSGHPFSQHYSDMMEMWRTVEYHPMLWDRPEVERFAGERLILDPARGSTLETEA